jgi:hypothetical protein
MEIKQLTGIFLDVYTDTVLNLSYGRFLTDSTLTSIKLPTQIDNYKYKHLIQPNQLLNIEIVKTKKNWILRHILQSKEIYKPKDYQDFLYFAESIKLIKQNLREEQTTSALPVLVEYWRLCERIDLAVFEKLLQKVLGFE